MSGQYSIPRPSAPPPLTILHVLAPAPVGGLESVVRALASRQRLRGHRVVVALIVDRGGAAAMLEAPLGAAGVETVTLVIGKRGYLRERTELAALYRRVEPSVVHTHGYREDIIAGGAARGLRIPTVTTVHGFTGGDFKNRLYELMQRRAFRGFDAVVAVSRSVQDLLAPHVRPERLHLIVNAYESPQGHEPRDAARALLGLPCAGVRLGWVGRLGYEKGPDVALEAFALLADLPLAMSFVGDGAVGNGLRERAQKLRVASRLTWHGIVPEAARLLPAFDVLVHSSRTEGTPVVLLEAMAAGVPIVATAVGGVPDLLGSGEAMLVPPDDPAALANAIRAVLASPRAAHHRAREAAYRLSQQYAVEPWLDRYEGVYRSVSMPRRVT
jgi:glycosyltransferase involved in cell wall biosynthesis